MVIFWLVCTRSIILLILITVDIRCIEIIVIDDCRWIDFANLRITFIFNYLTNQILIATTVCSFILSVQGLRDVASHATGRLQAVRFLSYTSLILLLANPYTSRFIFNSLRFFHLSRSAYRVTFIIQVAQ